MHEPASTKVGMRRKPRQARSQARINCILDVAEDLFASQGYAATTLNAIAFVLVNAIGTLLLAFFQPIKNVSATTGRGNKRFTLTYLQSYFA